MQIEALLKDTTYTAALLNGPCKPKLLGTELAPVNTEWIDEAASEAVTEAFHRLLPDGIPYLTQILVEHNPDTLYDGVCVNDNSKRQRYLILTVIPDTEYPYNYSFPLIHAMWTVALSCWEDVRATLAACRKCMQVCIATEPIPPILNKARLQWVTLYLGRAPYQGILTLSQQRAAGEAEMDTDVDVNLYKVREMELDPLLQRLIDAYDADFPEEVFPDGGAEV